MDAFKLPEPLVVDENVADRWKKFRQKFDLYLEATDAKEKSEVKKVAILLSAIGDDGLDLYNTFEFDKQDDKNKLEIVLKKFEDYCAPKKNIVFQRFIFNSIVQKEGQTFDNFVTELKKAVKSCDYKDEESMLRDRVVLGVRDKGTQERLLREPTLSLDKAVNFCKATETSKSQSKVLHVEELPINEVKLSNAKAEKTHMTVTKKCKYCGYQHKPGKCPAWKKTCAKCQGKNHFAGVCKAELVRTKKNDGVKRVYNVQDTQHVDSSDEEDSFYVSSIVKVGSLHSEKMWVQDVIIGNQNVKCKLDTGAEANVLPLSELMKINKTIDLKPTKMTLVSYGKAEYKLQPKGIVELECKINTQNCKVKFVVLDVEAQIPLLGLQTCIDLGLIRRIDDVCTVTYKSINDISEKYKTVFEGLGEFPSSYKIQLKDDIAPHIQPMKRVPFSINQKLKNKLDELESLGVIRKVDGPTEWVSNLVIVAKKNGDLRLCLDPKYLNLAIKREHFVIPTFDDIFYKLNGKKLFTVLDMKDGYWQIKLDNESINLCTFNSPFGRYQFCRLPFGICSAPEIFQKKNYEIFGDIPGIGIYFDDLIVTGESETEHDNNLKLVLERALKYNVKFNVKKIQFKQSKVKYMGQIFSEKGTEPDKTYVQAINEMRTPENKNELLRVLGMVKYLARFIPNMSQITAPLRELTKNDEEWKWLKQHDCALATLKCLLVNSPVLAYFDPKKSIVIQTDASKDGLGACLMQDDHPIAFASRTLTQTEQKWAQIEKETLAIVFATEKFSAFIFGHSDVTIHSDHKPLETIFKQDLHKVTVRLQAMRLKLLRFNFNIKYVPGKLLFVADTLSRAQLADKTEYRKSSFDFAIHALTNNLPMSDEKKSRFQNATLKDPILKEIISICNHEWPDSKFKVNPVIRKYWNVKQLVNVVDNLVFLGNKVIVPSDLRYEMLKLLHEGHCGIEKTKARARKVLYWPGINDDIEKFIKSCTTCEKFANKNSKEKLLPFPIANRPWQRVAADIFTYGNQSYLVVIDSYSNWLEIITIADKSAQEIIIKLKSIFSKHGSPDILVCDNVPFNSYKFKIFSNDWNFVIFTRSPYYPRANGLAEKKKGIAKKMLE